MNLRCAPGPLVGKVPAPPSKSYAHRWLIAGALSPGGTCLEGLVPADDVDRTGACLRALGARVDAGRVRPGSLPARAQLFCGQSGTTLRLLLPLAAALGVRASFDAEGSLLARPIGPLLDAMAAHGARLDSPALPLTVQGRLTSGAYHISGNVSSQFVSGLLLSLPLLAGDSTILLSAPLVSAGYVQMTLDVLARCGVRVEPVQGGYAVAGGQRYSAPPRVPLEGDWSSAAPLLVAGAAGGDVTVTGLSPASLQPDRVVAELLRRFGADIAWHDGGLRVRASVLHGITADLSQAPDLLPVLAVLGAVAQGETRLIGGAHLRYKESDRLQSTCAMLTALGADAELAGDGLRIRGGRPLRGGVVDSYGDHRIVMAAAVAATRCASQVIITGAQAVTKSYPGFVQDYISVGGCADVVDDR